MYKNKICGVYLITNNLNNMSYVGQSINCWDRWCSHKSTFANKTPIDKAIKEFGKENFTFKIEKECLPEELDFYERETIKKYNTMWPNGYNKMTGGREGFDICEESRSKMGRIRQGEKNPMYNHKHTEETRIKMSESHIGKGIGPKPKYKWLTPEGEIREMCINSAKHHHPDWTMIE